MNEDLIMIMLARVNYYEASESIFFTMSFFDVFVARTINN